MRGIILKSAEFVISIVLICGLFSTAGMAGEQASNQSTYAAPVASDAARAELVSFLEEARDYALKNGHDGALKAFNDPHGKFARGDMYVFAYDFNGTLLAHPYQHNLIGRNNLDLVDANGVHMTENLIELAREGQGFTYSVFLNPARGNQTELKLLYVLKVDGGMWISSGIYLPGQAPIFSLEDRSRLREFVDEARNYALHSGRDEALRVFNDPKGDFVRGDLYLFAFDFLGNVLCLPFQPDLLGTNRLNAKDANGVAFTRDNLDLSRGGSGQIYYIYPNPRENMRDELKLSYTAKVDDTWWLAAGIYSTSSANRNITSMKPTNRDELKAFVEDAKSHALFVGKEKALKDFMDKNGFWVRGDVYVFAQDFNGTSLCLPFLPQAVGTNRLDIQNDKGVYINREMRAIAMNGSGFYEYSWRKPLSNQSEPKVSFVARVDDSWWLGAGIYEA